MIPYMPQKVGERRAWVLWWYSNVTAVKEKKMVKCCEIVGLVVSYRHASAELFVLFVLFCFNHTVFTLLRVWQPLSPLRLRAGRLHGGAPLLLPFVPFWQKKESIQKWQIYNTKGKGWNQGGPTGPYSSARCPPDLAPLLVLGGNFPTSVAARKSITAWSHFSMESSSETFTCRHLPALHPVAFRTSFQSVICWSFYWLQWRKRFSHVWAVRLPPQHHQHSSLSRCPNRFRYVPTGACLDFSR